MSLPYLQETVLGLVRKKPSGRGRKEREGVSDESREAVTASPQAGINESLDGLGLGPHSPWISVFTAMQ